MLTAEDLQRDWAVALAPAVHAVGPAILDHQLGGALSRGLWRAVMDIPWPPREPDGEATGLEEPGRRAGALPGRRRGRGPGRRRLLLGPGGAGAGRCAARRGYVRGSARLGVCPAARPGLRRGGVCGGRRWSTSSPSERLGRCCLRRPPFSERHSLRSPCRRLGGSRRSSCCLAKHRCSSWGGVGSRGRSWQRAGCTPSRSWPSQGSGLSSQPHSGYADCSALPGLRRATHLRGSTGPSGGTSHSSPNSFSGGFRHLGEWWGSRPRGWSPAFAVAAKPVGWSLRFVQHGRGSSVPEVVCFVRRRAVWSPPRS